MKNKKLLIIVAAVVVVLAVVLAVVLLGGNKTPEVTEKEYKLGMGAVAGSHNASQTNLTVATVVLDDAGKIVACRLDVAQNKYKIEDEEVVFTNTDGEEFIFETDISGALSCVLPEGEYSVASRGYEGTLMIDKDTVISIGG